MKERLALLLLAITLSACNEQKNNNTSSADTDGSSHATLSVMSQFRPKLDPNLVREIEKEDLEKQRQQQEELEKQLSAQQQQGPTSLAAFLDPSKRNLPEVGKSSIGSGPLPNGTLPGQQPATPPAETTAAQTPAPSPMDPSSWQPPVGNTPAPPPPAATYATNYTAPPGATFVPPPPAVTVTGSIPGIGAPPPPEMAYAPSPYYPAYPYPQAQQAPPPPDRMARSANSVFGPANRQNNDDDDDQPVKKKEKNVEVITPTGMPLYSQYKQRDDLKALWQGTVVTSLRDLNRDEKISQQLKKVDVNLPAEPTRGMLSVSQRTQDALFKNALVDKKFVAQVKKSQTELIQAYYRYLFSYNKFSLTQQNVAARKQQMDLADSSAEKQRAAADFAQAQQEAESSKEDMRAAQNDLAAIAGAQSARLVISKVSGVAPSLESLSQADTQSDQQQGSIGGFFNSVAGAFGIGKKQEQPREEEKVAKAEIKDKGKDKEKDKGKDKKKGAKAEKVQVAATPPEQSTPSRPAATTENTAAVSPAPSGAVSFELKDVKTTPRKSILRVSIRNNGGENFSFDTDSVSVSEGNNKLADAAVRAEFDATIIQPSQEVTGTITIFGRPWNDKLSVSLSDGGKTILLHR